MDAPRITKEVGVLFILIASLFFALGYVWGNGSSVAPIVIEKCSDA